VDIVVKVPSGVGEEKLIQINFTGVAEGGMADVVSQRDGLDQIQIQMKGTADGAGDAGYQLNMETAAGNIIISH
jgi:hypothetical protein